jgi:hypothetical protein
MDVTGARWSAVARALFSAAALRGLRAARTPVGQWVIVAATTVLIAGAAGAAGAVSAGGAEGGAEAGPGDPPAAAADSFPHARHTKLACLECHETGAGHGRLTFEQPRGCALCHHQAPTPDTCGNCHRPEVYGTAKQVIVTINVPGRDPAPRPVDFLHARHESRTCVECHTTPVSLAPAPAVVQCQDCHVEHHAPGPNCSACHKVADPKLAHASPEVAHQRCDACHTAQSIERLTPTRPFCVTCHAPKATEHYDARECTVCHFLAEPIEYRRRLLTPPGGVRR